MNTSTPKLVIAAGTGFLGGVLTNYFKRAGWRITVLTRTPQASPEEVRQVGWDGHTCGDWLRELDGASAVINLAGRSVNCRYTRRNRELIMNSRINPTRVIGQAIARCKTPPNVWLNASTATIYKHTFGPAWAETGEIAATPEANDEFSVEVATAWERVFNEAQTPRTRKVALRSAMVFGIGGNSVFPALRQLTRLGLGGRLGTGRQFVSWIHETDFCRAVEWLVTHDQFSGPVNLAAPNPVSNAELMQSFREVCGVPFGLPAGKWMLEIGAFILRTETELLIKSRRVVPGRLSDSGFEFQYPVLRDTLRNLNECQNNQPTGSRIHQPA